MPIRRAREVLIIVFFIAFGAVNAQQTEFFRDADRSYHRAKQLMEKGQYESARRIFGEYIDAQRDYPDERFVSASYHKALCAMNLFHKDAEFEMYEFSLNFPESIWHRPALLELARYNFNRRDYDDAILYFNRLDLRDYSEEVQDEILFKKGFSAFENEDYELARTSFFPLLEKEGPYTGPVNYYYGHIAYKNENYQTALKSLRKAGEDPNFSAVVPYYVAQIYHFQEKYDELIDYAEPLVDSTSTKRREELAHLVGNAYYQKQDYKSAVPLLEIFMERNYNPEPGDSYQMAYAYYRTGNFKASITHFASASKAEDPALVQISTYQLADAYLKTGEKKFAQNAFKAASSMDEDREVTEDALFNYAKLAYELSYDPFHEAIQAFDRYLTAYPDSPRKDDAYAFLLKVHLATKNYPAAMRALDNMKNLGISGREDYQRAAYNHAVQLMREGKNDEALSYFKTSKKYNELPEIKALADYRIGDLQYREGNYAEAAAAYKSFVGQPSAYGTGQYKNADYNLGYCYFKLNNPTASLESFRKFTALPGIDSRRKYDALLRIGDLHLVGKDYAAAIVRYGEAMALNGTEGDYARFQTAMAYGYKEDHPRKIQELQRLFTDHPATSLAAVGQYQLGDSYFLTDDLNKALAAFNTVIDKHADSPYRKKALLKRGLVQYRLSNYEEAIASYEKVVKDYGVDAESREAIAVLRSIYLDLDRIDDYSKWLASLPDYQVSEGEIDSLSYRAAENLVADGKCTQAITSFGEYIRKYPNGLFIVNANYYRADCALRANDFEMALEGFEYVISQPASQFTEPSLVEAAKIRYRKKQFEEALALYERLKSAASFSANALEADIGVMRTNFRLKRYEAAAAGADAVLERGSATERVTEEARLVRGKSFFLRENYEKATPDFMWLATNSGNVEGAEAKYLLAQIAFRGGDLDKTEKEVFELIQGYASFDTWKVRGFLLLADVYSERQDYFQARATLQSVLDNVTDPDLLAEAEAKMKAVNEREAAEKNAAEAAKKAEEPADEDPYEELLEEEPENDNIEE
ncbi:MAG: tetratricopeptide repeat protein [Cryomorphaceae bacterium]